MEKQKTFGLPKVERLCSLKAIESLFASGKSHFVYPIRMVFQIVESDVDNPPVQVMFSVPRKRFKLAVTRNLIRRRMREAYRLNKHNLIPMLEPLNLNLKIAFLYSVNDVCDFSTIEKSIVTHLSYLGSSVSKND